MTRREQSLVNNIYGVFTAWGMYIRTAIAELLVLVCRKYKQHYSGVCTLSRTTDVFNRLTNVNCINSVHAFVYKRSTLGTTLRNSRLPFTLRKKQNKMPLNWSVISYIR